MGQRNKRLDFKLHNGRLDSQRGQGTEESVGYTVLYGTLFLPKGREFGNVALSLRLFKATRVRDVAEVESVR